MQLLARALGAAADARARSKPGKVNPAAARPPTRRNSRRLNPSHNRTPEAHSRNMSLACLLLPSMPDGSSIELNLGPAPVTTYFFPVFSASGAEQELQQLPSRPAGVPRPRRGV